MVKKMKHFKTLVFVMLLVIVGILLFTDREGKLKIVTKEVPNKYENIVITLLYPVVEKAVDEFYETYLAINPMVMQYDMKIKHIDYIRNDADVTKYIVTVEVSPFIGPHNYLGIERVVLNINVFGDVSVRKYEHLKSTDIFPLDRPLFKNLLPNS
ncbi:MAG: hypothetical protein K0R18_1683 [Bacillales bacterium]|jgi:hypothetical protein|nr:hypothetical protein [Bacillales bacterium]